ncbi:MAG: hypothetical protein NTU54_01030 [Candidatus Omnitrophica bacterium]|nr:hypothetical protein [Candidatus Omnitrophota bacterium]
MLKRNFATSEAASVVPISTLAKIEGGYILNSSMEILIKISDVFGQGVDDLLGRK